MASHRHRPGHSLFWYPLFRARVLQASPASHILQVTINFPKVTTSGSGWLLVSKEVHPVHGVLWTASMSTTTAGR